MLIAESILQWSPDGDSRHPLFVGEDAKRSLLDLEALEGPGLGSQRTRAVGIPDTAHRIRASPETVI